MQPNVEIDHEVASNLGLDRGPRRLRRWAVWIVLALVAIGAFAYWRHRAAAAHAGPGYVTAPVERGDLAVTVTATGTLEALETVDVSSEVSGRIAKIDVDFNDRVKKGQVLAVLDPQIAEQHAAEASAQVLAARANLVKAQATVAQMRQKLERQEALYKQGLISKDDLDTALADAHRSDADVASSRAQVAQAQASAKESQTALQKTNIVSPIDGVVLARNVEVGNTVAASLSAPVLFQIARDLTQMTLKVQVDEADVGKVHEGQPATFSVDAYPNRKFPSRVRQLRNVAKTDQNVVTYEALLDVQNPDLALRPGMTGTATIGADQRAGVLVVPNAALRFTPPDVLAQENGPRGGLFIPGVTRGNPFGRRGNRGGGNGASAQQGGGQQGGSQQGASAQAGPRGAAPAGGEASGGNGRAWSGRRGQGGEGAAAGQGASNRGQGANGAPGAAGASGAPGASGAQQGGHGSGRGGGNHGRVWVLKDGKPEPVFVGTGASDGQKTEVLWGKLQAGDQVIVDIQTKAPSEE